MRPAVHLSSRIPVWLRWILSIPFVFVVALAIAALAAVITISVDHLAVDGLFAIWKPLGAPPGDIEHMGIADANSNSHDVSIFAVSGDGKTFVRGINKNKNWQETTAPYLLREPSQQCTELSQTPKMVHYIYFDHLPGRVINCIHAVWNWEWSLDETIIVMLEDHTFWWWRRSSSLEIQIYVILAMLIFGFILGIILVKWYWKTHPLVDRNSF